jgi:aryl-alcohol dehydrogenase-like predicted oxidoreductase
VISRSPFGATGHESSRVIFGAAALGEVGQREADDALSLLLGHSINQVDTAASYGDSELRLAPWLREHRDDFFLATKTLERTYRRRVRRFTARWRGWASTTSTTASPRTALPVPARDRGPGSGPRAVPGSSSRT